MKLSIEYIGRNRCSSSAARCHGLVAARGFGNQAHLSHQSSHALLAALDSLSL